MFRSVLSVLAGIAVLTAASFAIEAAVNPLLLWAFPQVLPSAAALASNLWVRMFTFAYGFACVAAGGCATARMARRSPVAHALAMGLAQAGLTVAAMLSPEGNHASRTQWLLIAFLSVPAAVLGGLLAKRQRRDEELEGDPASA